jgi:outer membrane biosynthesis protein TonB
MRRRVIPAPRYPERVSVRLTGALVAALALLAALPAVASAQLSKGAQRVYDDYRSDAAIRPCDHSVKLYRRTLRQVTPAIEEETPAFRPAVEAALREREQGECAAPGDQQQDDESVGGSTPATPATPPATTPAPAPAAPKPSKPAKPATPAPKPPANEAAPQPTATPTTTVVPAPPVASSSPAPAQAPVLVDRPHEGTPVGLLIALGVLALALLLGLLALAARRFDRFAGARHAWGEAAYRAGGTWGDFVEWVRFGR